MLLKILMQEYFTQSINTLTQKLREFPLLVDYLRKNEKIAEMLFNNFCHTTNIL